MDKKNVDTLLDNKVTLEFEGDTVVASFQVDKAVGLSDFMDVVAILKEELGVEDSNIGVYAGDRKINIWASVGPRP